MVTDGLSNTLMASEGYIGHAQMRSCVSSPAVSPSDPVTGTYTFDQRPRPGPEFGRGAQPIRSTNCGTATGKVKAGGPIGHTRWANGGVYYSGFTTAMPPNHECLDGQPGHRHSPTPARTCRWTGTGSTRTTAARPIMSLSASSYHPGGVNALFADGSVHFVKNSVNPVTWHSLGTIAGGEVISSDHIDLTLRTPAALERPRGTDRLPPPAVSLFVSDGDLSTWSSGTDPCGFAYLHRSALGGCVVRRLLGLRTGGPGGTALPDPSKAKSRTRASL